MSKVKNLHSFTIGELFLGTAKELESLRSIGDIAFFNRLAKEEVAHIKIGDILYTKEGWQ